MGGDRDSAVGIGSPNYTTPVLPVVDKLLPATAEPTELDVCP
jgi:hypothetical protein